MNTPRSGSSGPGYICETRRIFTCAKLDGSGRARVRICRPHTRAVVRCCLRPVRGLALGRPTANALPRRLHPHDGTALAPFAVLRRRLNAAVLVAGTLSPVTAVLASIFEIVDVHASSSP